MKKGHLFTGIGYVLAGCALLAASLGSEGRLGSLPPPRGSPSGRLCPFPRTQKKRAAAKPSFRSGPLLPVEMETHWVNFSC